LSLNRQRTTSWWQKSMKLTNRRKFYLSNSNLMTYWRKNFRVLRPNWLSQNIKIRTWSIAPLSRNSNLEINKCITNRRLKAIKWQL
jgi:hypothetical protein